jgi:DNA-binding XRE family transcriptional regulator
MPKKRHTAEEIIQHLRTVEIEKAKGATLEDAARKVGVTPQTIVRWQNEFGGLRVDQAKRLKELEQENNRLKKIVANQAVDISILKEVASGNF